MVLILPDFERFLAEFLTPSNLVDIHKPYRSKSWGKVIFGRENNEIGNLVKHCNSHSAPQKYKFTPPSNTAFTLEILNVSFLVDFLSICMNLVNRTRILSSNVLKI